VRSRTDQSRFKRLWLLALALYGVGDAATTLALHAQVSTAVEMNPVMRAALATDPVAGVVGIKVAAVGSVLLVSLLHAQRARSRTLAHGLPLLLAALGAALTLNNLVVLATPTLG
jgi:hypothetical protein